MRKSICCTLTLATLAFSAAFALAQPANDLCSGAAVLPLNTIVYGTNAAATSANDGPTQCQASIVRSVWYRFNPETTGAYQVSSCGSPQDTVISVFSTVDCTTFNNAGFTAIACDDDACAGGVPGSGGNAGGSTFASIISSVALTAGTNYYIRLSTYGTGAAVPGPYQIAIFSTASAGACCSPTGACTLVPLASCAVTSTSVFMGAGTVCAPSPCQGACCLNGVGTCTVTQPGAATCPTGSTFSGYNTSCTPNLCPAPPVNDLCTSPTVISPASLPVSITGSNVGAVDTVAFAPAVCIASFKDVWYSFTPAVDNTYTLTTCNTLTGNFDTILTIHSACPDVADNHMLVCNDDACTGGAGPSTIPDFFLTAGTRYLIRVAAWTGATTSSSSFQLSITAGAVGACCTAGGCSITAPTACAAGTYLGDGTACTTAGICLGSCCVNATGSCSVTTSFACGAGSTFSGLGTTCVSNPCTTQACCNTATGACTITGSAACPSGSTAVSGQTTCDAFICPTARACCSPTGACVITGTTACPSGSSDQGVGTTCTPGLCPIPNDECGPQDPVLIVGTTATGTNFGASTSATLTNIPTDPYCNEATFSTSANDVFWRFIPTTSGDFELNTCGSDFDTALSIHAGCPASDANKLACNDDSAVGGTACLSGATQSRIPHVALTAGAQYFIRIAGFNGATGSISLTAIFNGTSGACCNASSGACTVVTNGAANCPSGTTYLGDNTACITSSCPIRACCNTSTGFCATTGSASCPVGTTAQALGSVCSPNPCPAPANDSCATVLASGPSITLANGIGSITSGFLGTATVDGTATCGLATGPDVWYRFTPAATGNYTILTCNSATIWDTTVSIWSDCATQLAAGCNDDGCGVQFGHGILGGVTLTAGTPYLIRVAAYAVDTANIAPFNLDVIASGACCNGTTCTLIADGSQTACAGTFRGVGTTCTPTLCAATGVCCRGSTCTTTITSSVACTASLISGQTAGATFATSATCNAATISNTPCCYADYNKAGGVTVTDIFNFLTDWFAGSPYANVGSTGAPAPLAVQNIFDFLTNWFAGGC